MWQDGLALLIVLIAAWMLFRTYAPKFRFGARQEGDGSIQNAPPAGGCGGCASGTACAKAQIKVHPVVIQQREQFPPR